MRSVHTICVNMCVPLREPTNERGRTKECSFSESFFQEATLLLCECVYLDLPHLVGFFFSGHVNVNISENDYALCLDNFSFSSYSHSISTHVFQLHIHPFPYTRIISFLYHTHSVDSVHNNLIIL